MIEDTAAEKLAAEQPPTVTPAPDGGTHRELDAMLAQRLEKLRMESVVAPNSAVRAVLEGRMEAIVLHRNAMQVLFELERRLARLETRP